MTTNDSCGQFILNEANYNPLTAKNQQQIIVHSSSQHSTPQGGQVESLWERNHGLFFTSKARVGNEIESVEK